MSTPQRIFLSFRALGQLGARALLPYAWYRFKLHSGLLSWQTPGRPLHLAKQDYGLHPLFPLPGPNLLKESLGRQAEILFTQAGEIAAGRVRLFAAEPQPLGLHPPKPLQHWTRTVSNLPDGSDIKPLWEMGRFGWATLLARAYHLGGNEDYARAFWQRTEEFLLANPPNLGPHWSSAQEVALRLIALAFSYTLVASSTESTHARRELITAAIAAHAQRIPPTLAYAQAQNNNHLLSETLGLLTAGALLPHHPEAAAWRRLGQVGFQRAVLAQIASDGSYVQHSSNYHRLMLQLGLWWLRLGNAAQAESHPEVLERFAAATRWLLTLLDESGRVPNLGPNDGAYILPLTVQPFEDFRPVLQAAGQAFLEERLLPPGPWDEMALWLTPEAVSAPTTVPHQAMPLRLEGRRSWAYLRAAKFRSRPGHADQLHLDLWWRGLNLAQDAGSYRYTAAPPWDNALAGSRVHNTLTVNGQDQMTRAGRFLWLDWAQARILETQRDENGRLVAAHAEHDGYRRLGLRHERKVQLATGDEWLVQDSLLPVTGNPKAVEARLHWLLPDWEWRFADGQLALQSLHGRVLLSIQSEPAGSSFQLSRAGELLLGDGPSDPILGWVSPTYNLKQPALSLIAFLHAEPPITLSSTWTLPSKS